MRAPGPCAPTARSNTNATRATTAAASTSFSALAKSSFIFDRSNSARLRTQVSDSARGVHQHSVLALLQEFPPSLADREGSARKKSILISRIVTRARWRSRLRRSCAYEAGRTSRRIRRICRGIDQCRIVEKVPLATSVETASISAASGRSSVTFADAPRTAA
jgi:hypothetical protein